jgi:3-methylfumaryl-CoA hydratase
MWAGGRLEFHQPLHVGDEITRDSQVVDVSVKQGRSGDLLFVTIMHEIANARGLALREMQRIVYSEKHRPDALTLAVNKAARVDETFSREVMPDPVLLFRYSALTFNAHRIHYDRAYAVGVEGYPGLVVQGPLVATLLVELLRHQRPGATLRNFSFKAVSPLFDIHPFSLCGRAGDANEFVLWARDYKGTLAMDATATID